MNVYGPTTSEKTADAAVDAYTSDSVPAQKIVMKKLPKLRELRGET